MNTGLLGATSLLAGAIASVNEGTSSEGVGAGDFVELAAGVEATVILPSGDRYRVSVVWLGDNEAAA